MTRSHSSDPHGRPSFAMVRLFLAAVPLAAGYWALRLGQDASWDLRNYHFYNAYSYLTDRMGFDVAAAQVATYYNPLMHLPFYHALTSLPPRAVGFLLGMVPGFNALLLYAIIRQTVRFKSLIGTDGFCLIAALVGFLGANSLGEIGTSFGDNWLSLPVLVSLLLILRFRDRFSGPGFSGSGVAIAAGLLSGAAFGMKLPFAVYCVGLCAAFFGLSLPFHKRFFLAFVFGLGVLAGTALTGGFWMAEMWEKFQNPLFPYFNQYFQSPWAASDAYRDERFIPQTLSMKLFFPIGFTMNPLQVGEIPFRDLRFPVLYLLLIVWMIRTILRGRAARSDSPPVNGKAEPEGADLRSIRRFIILFMGISFVLWMNLFAVYRYAIVCELLAPLAIFLVLGALVRNPSRQTQLTLACFILILTTLSPGNWGRRPWAADYFGVEAPEIKEPAHTLVLMTGHEPMAYMIPFFPPEVRFLRIHSYMTGPSASPNGMDRLMQDIVALHRGVIFILYRVYEEETAIAMLKAYGLEIQTAGCVRMTPHAEPQQNAPFHFCPVRPEKPLRKD